MIGYDIITPAWVKCHEVHLSKAHGEPMVAVESLEEMCCSIDQSEGLLPPGEDFQAAQRKCFDDFRSRGGKWLVSDFVTIGSAILRFM